MGAVRVGEDVMGWDTLTIIESFETGRRVATGRATLTRLAIDLARMLRSLRQQLRSP